MSEWYILEGRTPKAATMEEWSRWRTGDRDQKRVARDEFGDITVSTVFLGLNHAYDENSPPIIFETMIFGGAFNEDQWRCSTYDEAEAQHAMACKLVTDSLASVA